jgi:hypothetical protein
LNTTSPTAVAQEVTALRDARDIRLGSLHGDYFSKVLSIATLHSKCTRPMTFENLCQGLRFSVMAQSMCGVRGTLARRRAPFGQTAPGHKPCTPLQNSTQRAQRI